MNKKVNNQNNDMVNIYSNSLMSNQWHII